VIRGRSDRTQCWPNEDGPETRPELAQKAPSAMRYTQCSEVRCGQQPEDDRHEAAAFLCPRFHRLCHHRAPHFSELSTMSLRNQVTAVFLLMVLLAGYGKSMAAEKVAAGKALEKTTLHWAEKGRTADATVSEGPAIDGKRSVHYHVEYAGSAQCRAVFDGNARFHSDTDEAGDSSEALPNGDWATINQFRDMGPNGLVVLTLDVDAAHPRFIDFSLEHPSNPAQPCVPVEGVQFMTFADQTATVPAADVKKGAKRPAVYTNVRYDFSIRYPADLLVKGRESDNGDGVQFSARSGHGDVAVWARYNASGETPAQLLRFEQSVQCAGEEASYEVSKRNLIAFSCRTPKGEIVYQKMLIHGDTLVAVHFSYPAGEQSFWSPVITDMTGSLQVR